MITRFDVGSSGDAARYHDKAFSEDGALTKADNYYLDEKAPAVWDGKGAEILGMDGQAVSKADFIAFLEGRLVNPETGELQDLGASSKGSGRRLGTDLTITPPKSVSIVALVGSDERVIRAHMEANKEAMSWLEQHTSIVRDRSPDGTTYKQVGNFLYATVVHATNRENEPNLHSHNVLTYAVYDKERSTWRSLTNDELFKQRASADVVYKLALAAKLNDLGYEVTFAKNGVDFEVNGISQEAIKEYSQRTALIEAALKAKGLDPATATFEQRTAAKMETRKPKQDIGRDVLVEHWKHQAEYLGFDIDGVVNAARDRTKLQATPGAGRESADRAVGWAIQHLSEREQSFTMVDLELTAMKFGRHPLSQVSKSIQTHIENRDLLHNGYQASGLSTYTTKEAIAPERALAADVEAQRGKGNVVLTSEAEFQTALGKFEAGKSERVGMPFKLTDEQVLAARAMLMHQDAFQGVQGDAGTGKTAVLEFVREAAEAKGWRVEGQVTSSKGSRNLQDESGIKSETVTSYFKVREKELVVYANKLNQLEKEIEQAKSLVSGTLVGHLEIQKLNPTRVDGPYGEARYLFDHKRGAVFRADNSVTNLLGGLLTDFAGTKQQDMGNGSGESLATNLRAMATRKGVDAMAWAGRKLTHYQAVDTAESVAAREALHAKRAPLEALQKAHTTALAEHQNLKRTGNVEGQSVLLVVDEATLTGVKDMQNISRLAIQSGARVVWQGDVKQHGSVAAGRGFQQMQDFGMNVSTLVETRRFINAVPSVHRALDLYAKGNYEGALDALPRQTTSKETLTETVMARYMERYKEARNAGTERPDIVVLTNVNKDRKAFNAAIQSALVEQGFRTGPVVEKDHLDSPQLTAAEKMQVSQLAVNKVDTLVFTKSYTSLGVKQGKAVAVESMDQVNNTVTLRHENGRTVSFSPQLLPEFEAYVTEKRSYATGDVVMARANLKYQKGVGGKVLNGTQGVVTAVNADGATIKWKDGRELRATNDQLKQIDLAYSLTTQRDQGSTHDGAILATSQAGAFWFTRNALYVGITRARNWTEVVSSDYDKMRDNVSRTEQKTAALASDVLKRLGIKELERAERDELAKQAQQAPTLKQHLVDTLSAMRSKGAELADRISGATKAKEGNLKRNEEIKLEQGPVDRNLDDKEKKKAKEKGFTRGL